MKKKKKKKPPFNQRNYETLYFLANYPVDSNNCSSCLTLKQRWDDILEET